MTRFTLNTCLLDFIKKNYSFLFIGLFAIIPNTVLAQNTTEETTHPEYAKFLSDRSLFPKSDTIILFVITTNCRLKQYSLYRGIEKDTLSKIATVALIVKEIQLQKPINLKGEIVYDYIYRNTKDSFSLAPILSQHNIQVNFSTIIAKRFPLGIQINARKSNSTLFKDYIDVGLQFEAINYQTDIRERLKARVIERIKQENFDPITLKLIEEKTKEKLELQKWLSDGKRIQDLINGKSEIETSRLLQNEEAKLTKKADQIITDSLDKQEDSVTNNLKKIVERNTRKNLLLKSNSSPSFLNVGDIDIPSKKINAIKIDTSLTTELIKEYAAKSKKLDSLSQHIDNMRTQFYACKKETEAKIDSFTREFNELQNPIALNKHVTKYAPHEKTLSGFSKILLGIRKLSIGRSFLDYSELSVKNISINGFNGEYSSNIYLAAATGVVDYSFRDFRLNSSSPRQYINLFRVGIGEKNSNNVILTIYSGVRQFPYTNDRTRISGVTLETKYYVAKDCYLLAEIAKSTYPKNAVERKSNFLNVNDNSNMGYSLKLFYDHYKTGTTVQGDLKYLGYNFQSFNVYNYNTDFKSWSIRL
ncbi:MAG: hypothetical protein ABUT20_47330, partial [Bacteroidota bacterium]